MRPLAFGQPMGTGVNAFMQWALRSLRQTEEASRIPDIPKAPSYLVADVPSAMRAGEGAMIYVSDETGGAVLAFSDGSDWRRVTDRQVVS